MMGFGDAVAPAGRHANAVAPAGRHANKLHLAQDR